MLKNPYYFTVSEPSVVTHAIRATFTGPKDTNLIICRSSSIEVFVVSDTGLHFVCKDVVYAKICFLQRFRPKECKTDRLFLVTSCRQYAIVEWDISYSQFITISSGPLHTGADPRRLKPLQQKMGFITDDGVAVMMLYPGELTVFHSTEDLQKKTGKKSKFTLYMHELDVVDIVHMEGCELGFAILFRDYESNMEVRSYNIMRTEELTPGWIASKRVSKSALHLIKVNNGVVCLSTEKAEYLGRNMWECKFEKPFTIQCVCPIENEMFLISEVSGDYHVLNVEEKRTLYIGRTHPCLCAVYLDNGFVYLGSRYGDSALIQMLEVPLDQESIQVVNFVTGIGPISDFVQVQGKLILCSGAFTQGCLSKLRYGIDLSVDSNADVCVKKLHFQQNVLALTLADKTIFMVKSGKDYMELDQFCSDPTIEFLYLGFFVQICNDGIHVFAEQKFFFEIGPISNACWGKHVFVSKNTEIIALLVNQNNVEILYSREFKNTVTSMIIFEQNIVMSVWPNIVYILDLNLNVSHQVEAPGLVRSLAATDLIFLGLECGTVVILNDNLQILHTLSIGTQRVFLRVFDKKVYVLCDSSVILTYHDHPKTSSLNIQNIFDILLIQDVFFIATGNGMLMGKIDPIERLHIQKHNLRGETACCVCHHSETNLIIALCELLDNPNHSYSAMSGFVRAFHPDTFSLLFSFTLDPDENPLSILEMKQYILVGTYYSCDAFDPKEGRIIVLEVENLQFKLVASYKQNNAVYCFGLLDSFIVAAISNRIVVFDENFQQLTEYSGLILAIEFKIKDNLIYVGDVMKGITVLRFCRETKKLSLGSRSLSPIGVSCMQLIDDHVLVADQCGNLSIIREKNNNLETIAAFNVADTFTCFRHGSLFENLHSPVTPVILCSASSGRIAVVANINDDYTYNVLCKLQQILMGPDPLDPCPTETSPLVCSIGNFEYRHFRAFKTERKTSSAVGFIDGDLISRFKYLSPTIRTRLCSELKKALKVDVNVQQLQKIVSSVIY